MIRSESGPPSVCVWWAVSSYTQYTLIRRVLWWIVWGWMVGSREEVCAQGVQRQGSPCSRSFKGASKPVLKPLFCRRNRSASIPGRPGAVVASLGTQGAHREVWRAPWATPPCVEYAFDMHPSWGPLDGCSWPTLWTLASAVRPPTCTGVLRSQELREIT